MEIEVGDEEERRLWKICGRCHYFQPPEGVEGKMEPECLVDEDVESTEYCESFLRRE